MSKMKLYWLQIELGIQAMQASLTKRVWIKAIFYLDVAESFIFLDHLRSHLFKLDKIFHLHQLLLFPQGPWKTTKEGRLLYYQSS